jgi:hypothetical protein
LVLEDAQREREEAEREWRHEQAELVGKSREKVADVLSQAVEGVQQQEEEQLVEVERVKLEGRGSGRSCMKRRAGSCESCTKSWKRRLTS